MIKVVLSLMLVSSAATRHLEAQGGAPQIKCEVGTASWCIATFDGSIDMQDAGEARIWTLQARTATGDSPMRIVEAKACSDAADELVQVVKAETEDVASRVVIAEYILGSNGCKLRFEIPEGESATYRQVMLYGILVGSEKRTQLYKAKEAEKAK